MRGVKESWQYGWTVQSRKVYEEIENIKLTRVTTLFELLTESETRSPPYDRSIKIVGTVKL